MVSIAVVLSFVGILVFHLFLVSVGSLVIKLVTISFHNYNLFDKPDGNLKKHILPVPFSGGAGIFLTIVFLTLLYSNVEIFFNCSLLELCGVTFKNWAKIFLLPMILAFPIDFYDDIVRLSPSKKFIFQVLFSFIAVCVFASKLSLLQCAVSFAFILSLINALNLIDVSDGLCLSVSIPATISLILIAQKTYCVLFLFIFLLAQVAAFLFNKPNATIYLGNSGSGFLSAVFSLIILDSVPFCAVKDFLAIVTIFGVFFAELVALIIIRLSLGLKPYQGSPHHIASFLKNGGWSKWRILVFTACASQLLGILGFLLYFEKIGFLIYSLTITLALVLWTSVIYWPTEKLL